MDFESDEVQKKALSCYRKSRKEFQAYVHTLSGEEMMADLMLGVERELEQRECIPEEVSIRQTEEAWERFKKYYFPKYFGREWGDPSDDT